MSSDDELALPAVDSSNEEEADSSDSSESDSDSSDSSDSDSSDSDSAPSAAASAALAAVGRLSAFVAKVADDAPEAAEPLPAADVERFAQRMAPPLPKAPPTALPIPEAPIPASEALGTKGSLLPAGRVSEATKATRAHFAMPTPKLTPEVKRELLILAKRNYLSRKSFYKSRREDGRLPKTFVLGTVVDPVNDARVGRTKVKNGKRTMAQQLVEDAEFQNYSTNHSRSVRDRRTAGNRQAYYARQAALRPAWAKRHKTAR